MSSSHPAPRGLRALLQWFKGDRKAEPPPKGPDHYPNLWQFFTGYFHQDWPLEAADWQGMVASYREDILPETTAATVAELEELLAEGLTEEQLATRLFRDLGCHYTPRPDLGGPTFADWLKQVRAELEAEPLRPVSPLPK